MGKLRHLAITVPDIEAAAGFYEQTFEMHRVWQSDIGVMLSDGTVSLAILKFPTDEMAGDERGKDFEGLHHLGFVVEDLEATGKAIESRGGRYHMQIPGGQAGSGERKFRDPNGVVVDIVDEEYCRRGWGAAP